jgi:uncharacterized protein (DUF488 family)
MPRRIYTIGHSTRPFEELVHLLQSHGITLLVDVRARPQSRFYPHFNRKYLEANLPMKYLWLGDKLGGKNSQQIPPEEYAAGIEKLIELAKKETVCIMCSEGSPTPTKWRPEGCHRWSTITPSLHKKGMDVVHI